MHHVVDLKLSRSPQTARIMVKAFLIAFVFAFCLIGTRPSSAQTESILYSTALYENPLGGVVMDSQGNLYGTTTSNGVNDRGEVFKLAPPAQPGGEWIPTILHVFNGLPDGEYPIGNLLLDSKGNLYGVAGGGSQGGGVVFAITAAGVEKILYSFKLNKIDGHGPTGGLVRDRTGNFYGMTGGGGTSNEGTIFRLTPAGKETVLYSFQGGTDGYNPVGALTIDSGQPLRRNLEGWLQSRRHCFQVNPRGRQDHYVQLCGQSNRWAISLRRRGDG